MKVKVLNGLAEVHELDATRVLVTYDDGTPAVAAIELQPGLIAGGHAQERGFPTFLASLGIDRTVQLETIAPARLDDFRI